MSSNKLSKSSESKPTQSQSKDLPYLVAVGYSPAKGPKLVETFNFKDYTQMINTLLYIFEGKHSVIKESFNPQILYAKHNDHDIKWKVLNNVKTRLNTIKE